MPGGSLTAEQAAAQLAEQAAVPTLFPYEIDANPILTGRYRTQIDYEKRGSEDRTPFDDQIRYRLQSSWTLNETQAQDLREKLESLRTKTVRMPMWPHATNAATITQGDTTITVDDLPGDWNCATILVWQDWNTYDILTVASVPTGNTIALATYPTKSYADATVMPLRDGYLQGLPSVRGLNASDAWAEFDFLENYGNQLQTGLHTAPTMFRGRPVFDFLIDWDEPTESWEDNVEIQELGFGNPLKLSEADLTIRRHAMTLDLEGEELTRFWGLYQECLGRYRAAWLPSYRTNHRLAADITAYAREIRIEAANLVDTLNTRASTKYIAVITDNGAYAAEILKVVKEGDVEVLSLSDAIPEAVTKQAGIVCHLDLVRFAEEEVAIQYVTPTAAKAGLNMIELPFEYEGSFMEQTHVQTLDVADTFVGPALKRAKRISLQNDTGFNLELRRADDTANTIRLQLGQAITLRCDTSDEFQIRREDQVAEALKVSFTIDTVSERHPVWLYKFSPVNAASDFTERFFTSHRKSFTIGVNTFSPAHINHGSIRRTLELTEDQLDLEMIIPDEEDQLWDLLDERNPELIQLTIYETDYYAPDLTNEIHTGLIKKVSNDQDLRLTFTVGSRWNWGDPLSRNKLSRRCRHQLFNTGCTLLETNFQETGTITEITTDADGWPIVKCTLTGSRAAGWFAGGKITVGNEIRSCADDIREGLTVVLYMTLPFKKAVVGDAITVTAGCDKSFDTCINKFANANNFGGMPYMPNENPTLKAMEVPTQDLGGKK